MLKVPKEVNDAICLTKRNAFDNAFVNQSVQGKRGSNSMTIDSSTLAKIRRAHNIGEDHIHNRKNLEKV